MDTEMTPERRMVVALLLSFAVYLGWAYYTVDKRRHAATAAQMAPATELDPAPVAPSVAAPADLEAAGKEGLANGPLANARPAETPEQLIDIDTPELHLTLSDRGGTLVHARLKAAKYQRSVDGSDQPVDLAREGDGARRPLEMEFGGPLADWPSLATYTATPDSDGMGVRFTRRVGGAFVEKHFQLVAPYLAQLEVVVRGAAPEHLGVAFPGTQPPGSSAATGIFGFGRATPNSATGLCGVDGAQKRGQGGRAGEIKAERATYPTNGSPGEIQFAALDERFFMGAIYPAGLDRRGQCTVESRNDGLVSARIEVPLETGKPRQFGIYLGPKDFDRLRQASALPGQAGPTAGLDAAIDFGFWTVLDVPMLLALDFFHGTLVHNWGVAILLLTLAIKLALFPLQQRVFRSMEQMKKLSPQVEELKKRHANDKERLNLETMKLYSDNGANPFGSCLPMLVQLPIWLALYRLLSTTVQLYREPFIRGWINDLTAADPFYLLPLGMGATMVVTQLMTPQTMENSQQKALMWFMPAFFTLTFLKVPAGLSLYIFSSNLLNILQQYVLKRTLQAKPSTARAAHAPPSAAASQGPEAPR